MNTSAAGESGGDRVTVHRTGSTKTDTADIPPQAQRDHLDRINTTLARAVALILAENRQMLGEVHPAALSRLITLLADTERVFVVGEGRSGLALRMVAMRLMHLGHQVHVVGETTTPALRPDDLLIACSGSGTTAGVVALTTQADAIGSPIVAVTTAPDSPLGRLATVVITIPAATKSDHSRQISEQFAGSLFEQSALLLFDAIFHTLTHNVGVRAETLSALHANLE